MQETAPQLQLTLLTPDKIEFGLTIAPSYRVQGGNCPGMEREQEV